MGNNVGERVGLKVGESVGDLVGALVGLRGKRGGGGHVVSFINRKGGARGKTYVVVGFLVGLTVGESVGAAFTLGMKHPCTPPPPLGQQTTP